MIVRMMAGGGSPEPIAAAQVRDGFELLAFPCDGDPRWWPFTEGERDKLAAAFPEIDVHAEARRALAWVLALPSRRKTHDGMRRFLTAWMMRSKPHSHGGPGPARAGRSPFDGQPRFDTRGTALAPRVDRTAETDRKLAAARAAEVTAAESWPRDEDGNQLFPKGEDR
jgi:hypothetical protein